MITYNAWCDHVTIMSQQSEWRRILCKSWQHPILTSLNFTSLSYLDNGQGFHWPYTKSHWFLTFDFDSLKCLPTSQKSLEIYCFAGFKTPFSWCLTIIFDFDSERILPSEILGWRCEDKHVYQGCSIWGHIMTIYSQLVCHDNTDVRTSV